MIILNSGVMVLLSKKKFSSVGHLWEVRTSNGTAHCW